MMKKLAVTVFVLSLAAVGCGSDGGTPVKTDAGKDAKTDVAAPQPDTNQPDKPIQGPEVQVGPEVQADKPVVIDVTPSVEVQAVEVQAVDVTTQIDGAIDGANKDVTITPDVRPVDVQAGEAATTVDAGGVDGGTRG